MTPTGLGSVWSTMSNRFTKSLTITAVSAVEPLLILGNGIFRQICDLSKYCPVENSHIPDIGTIIEARTLRTRLYLIGTLAAHLVVMYGTATLDAAISILYDVVFARMYGMTSQVEKAILQSELSLIRKANMRTGRSNSDRYSSGRIKKMKGSCISTLAMPSPRTGQTSAGPQTKSCPHSIPRMNLKIRMISLFLSFSMLMNVSKTAPITSHYDVVACKAATGDLPSDCQIDTSASLTPGARAVIATCVLVAVVVLLIAVFGVPQAWRESTLMSWNAHLPEFNREVLRWPSSRNQPRVDERVVQNGATAEATVGDHSTDMHAYGNPVLRVHSRLLSFGSRLFRRLGVDQGDEGHVPTSSVPNERDEVMLRMGAIFESITMERPLQLHDLDLIHSSQD